MIAWTSPAFTMRSRPLRISLPSISTCRFSISSNGIKNSGFLFNRARRLFVAPAPAPIAFGFLSRDEPKADEDNSINEHGDPKPGVHCGKSRQPPGRGGQDEHPCNRDRPALPGHGRGAVAELLGSEPIGGHDTHVRS